MKCPNCSGQLGLEDAFCPYCGTPNAMAAKHQSDMARFQAEYQRTQADVMQKTTLLQRHGSWLVILVVLLVGLIVGIVLNTYAWDIGYGMRTNSVVQKAAEDQQAMDAYLANGDYGQFVGYYDANDVSLNDDNPYQALWTAASAYTSLLESLPVSRGSQDFRYTPEHVSGTCTYLAEDLNRIFALEQRYSYDLDRYLPADKMVYVQDIRERAAVIAKAYFGLTDADIQEIPNMSVTKLASLIEEGVAR